MSLVSQQLPGDLLDTFNNSSGSMAVDVDLLNRAPLIFFSGAVPPLPAHLWGGFGANQLSLPGSIVVT